MATRTVTWFLIGSVSAACSPLRDPSTDPSSEGQGAGVGADGDGPSATEIDPAPLGEGDDESTPGTGTTVHEQPTDCIVSHPGDPDSYRVTWSASEHVKEQHETTAADSAVKLAWRYTEQGQLIAYAGFGSGEYGSFQHDYLLDEHGNARDMRLSYPSKPDLKLPSPASVWMGTTYANTYDAQGELLVSTATPYGPGNAPLERVIRSEFARDGKGRCRRIERTGGDNDSVELRDYDGAGRLEKVDVEHAKEQPWMRCRATVTSYEYDDSGRLRSVVTMPRSGLGCDESVPLRAERRDYAADGSLTIETLDYTTDVVNHKLTIDGALHSVWRNVEVHSAGCARVDTATAGLADGKCRVR